MSKENTKEVSAKVDTSKVVEQPPQQQPELSELETLRLENAALKKTVAEQAEIIAEQEKMINRQDAEKQSGKKVITYKEIDYFVNVKRFVVPGVGTFAAEDLEKHPHAIEALLARGKQQSILTPVKPAQ